LYSKSEGWMSGLYVGLYVWALDRMDTMVDSRVSL
jgi:hypothetical protein